MTFSFDSCQERQPMMCCALRTCTFFLGWSVCAVLPWFTWPLWTTWCGWCGLHGSSLSHAWKQTVLSSSPIILLKWDVHRFLHINCFVFLITTKKEMCREALFSHGWNFNNEHLVCFCFHGLWKKGITFWVFLTFFQWVSVSMPWLETCEHLLIFIFPILGFPYTVHTAAKLTEIAICVQWNPSWETFPEHFWNVWNFPVINQGIPQTTGTKLYVTW